MKKISFRRKTFLVAALLATASIGVGVAGTVAFFQSSHSFDVTVNAAKVDVAQNLPTIESSALQYIADGASVKVDQTTGSVTANLLVPGDTFLIKSTYTNNSTIGVKYRIKVEATTGLKTEIFTDANCTTAATDGDYTNLATKAAIADHYIKVTVTDDFENGGTGKVTVGVNAVQNNVNPVAVSTATDFTTELADTTKDTLYVDSTMELPQNVSSDVESAYRTLITHDVTIDLQGNKLTDNNYFTVQAGKTLTLKNGIFDSYALFADDGSNIVLDNIEFSSNPDQQDAIIASGSVNVTIKNSTVHGALSAIKTEGKKGNLTSSKITITNSILEATDKWNHFSCGLAISNGNDVSITDSTIKFENVGISNRGGSVTLTDVTLEKTGDYNGFNDDTTSWATEVNQGIFRYDESVPECFLFVGSDNTSNNEDVTDAVLNMNGNITFKVDDGVKYHDNLIVSANDVQNVVVNTNGAYKGDVKVYDFREQDTKKLTINNKDIAKGTYGHAGTATDKYTIA